MKRRDFLAAAAATAAAAAFGNPNFLFAQSAARHNILLVFLRGGADPLMMFPMALKKKTEAVRVELYGSDGKSGRRPALKVADEDILDFLPGSSFGFHSKWKPLLDATRNSEGVVSNIALVGPLGIPYEGAILKSHADCQLAAISGELNLVAAHGLVGKAHNKYRDTLGLKLLSTVGLGQNPSRELYDPEGQILNLSNFKNYSSLSRESFSYQYSCNDFRRTASIQHDDFILNSTISRFKELEGKQGRFSEAFRAAKESMDRSLTLVEKYIKTVKVSGNYPKSGMGIIFKDIAKYFTSTFTGASVTPNIRIVQYSPGESYDTHNNQADVLPGKIGNLAEGLAALIHDLRATEQWVNTSIVVMSEFGRTISQNGGGGSDHGHGSVTMVISGKLTSGKEIGEITLDDLKDPAHIRMQHSFHAPLNEVFSSIGMDLGQLIDSPLLKDYQGNIEKLRLFS